MRVRTQRPAVSDDGGALRFVDMGPARLERATSCSGGKRSIQLSYGPGTATAKQVLGDPFLYPFNRGGRI